MSTLEHPNGWRTLKNWSLRKFTAIHSIWALQNSSELSSLKHLEEVGAIFEALHLMQDIAPPSTARVLTMGKQPSCHLRVNIEIHSTRLQGCNGSYIRTFWVHQTCFGTGRLSSPWFGMTLNFAQKNFTAKPRRLNQGLPHVTKLLKCWIATIGISGSRASLPTFPTSGRVLG